MFEKVYAPAQAQHGCIAVAQFFAKLFALFAKFLRSGIGLQRAAMPAFRVDTTIAPSTAHEIAFQLLPAVSQEWRLAFGVAGHSRVHPEIDFPALRISL